MSVDSKVEWERVMLLDHVVNGSQGKKDSVPLPTFDKNAG